MWDRIRDVYLRISSDKDRHIDVRDRKLDAESVKHIANALSYNLLLTSIDLSENKLGDDGIVHIADVLAFNKTIKQIKLSATKMGPDGAAAIAKAIRTNRSLSEIDLSRNILGNEGAKHIFNALENANNAITSIDLSNNAISHAKHIASCIRRNDTIQKIDLGANSLADYGTGLIASSLKTHRRSKEANTIPDHSGNNSDHGGGSDGGSPSSFSPTSGSVPSLTSILLHFNKIGVEGAKSLGECLAQNSTLTTLHVENNKLGKDGAHFLAQGLKTNKSLRTLDVASNNMGAKGTIALIEGLWENYSLTSLNLSANQIGDEGACALANWLQRPPLNENDFHRQASKQHQLRALHIGSNRIGFGGVQAIAGALKRGNLRLKHLDLGYNEIDVEGARFIAGAINEQQHQQSGRGIERLYLHFNNLETRGAVHIARLLRFSTSLRYLNLFNCQIGRDGAEEIAQSLLFNPCLQEITWDEPFRLSSLLRDHLPSELSSIREDNQLLAALSIIRRCQMTFLLAVFVSPDSFFDPPTNTTPPSSKFASPLKVQPLRTVYASPPLPPLPFADLHRIDDKPLAVTNDKDEDNTPMTPLFNRRNLSDHASFRSPTNTGRRPKLPALVRHLALSPLFDVNLFSLVFEYYI